MNPIEKVWLSYEKAVLFDASEAVKRTARLAFFGGAGAVAQLVLQTKADPMDVARLVSDEVSKVAGL